MNRYIHVVRGDSGAGTLRPRHFVVLRDTLSVGPCSVDPEKHREKRHTYWRENLEEDLAGRPHQRDQYLHSLDQDIFAAAQLADALRAFPGDQPVLLWTAALWRERLTFWWALDAIERTGLPRERFEVAEPEVRDLTIGCFPEESFRSAFARRRPLSARTLREGASLWRKFASPSPRLFEEARLRGSEAFPDLSVVAEPLGWFFPRVEDEAGKRLRLGTLDQLLLDQLSPDDWLRPVELLRERRVLEHFFPLGDELIGRRLRAWSAHQPTAPLLLHRQVKGVNRWTRVEYRLTSSGLRIREEGLGRAEEAPLLEVGGFRAYAGKPPWVLHSQGEGWRLRPLAAGLVQPVTPP
jgi:hypothetical protein